MSATEATHNKSNKTQQKPIVSHAIKTQQAAISQQ